DVLGGLRALKLCVGYRLDGSNQVLDELPLDLEDLARARPIYEDLDGWEGTRPMSEVRDFDDLPRAAQRYVRRIEELVGVSASLISVGPGRAETIVLKNPFR